MAVEWVTVETFTSRAAAELARGLLEEHGIEAEIRADDAGGALPQLGLKGVRLEVDREDIEEAREILQISPAST